MNTDNTDNTDNTMSINTRSIKEINDEQISVVGIDVFVEGMRRLGYINDADKTHWKLNLDREGEDEEVRFEYFAKVECHSGAYTDLWFCCVANDIHALNQKLIDRIEEVGLYENIVVQREKHFGVIKEDADMNVWLDEDEVMQLNTYV